MDEPDYAMIYKKAMDDHNQKVAEFAEKYIGKQEINRCKTMTDVYFQKEWYIQQIKRLMYQSGRSSVRLRKCKYNSPKWQQYLQVEKEIELLVDALSLELKSL